MPREKRMLMTSIWMSTTMGKLPTAEAQLLWPLIICHTYDDARFKADPAVLRAQAGLTKLAQSSLEDIQFWLEILDDHGTIALYTDGQNQYGVCLKFHLYQTLQKPQPSPLPPPPKAIRDRLIVLCDMIETDERRNIVAIKALMTKYSTDTVPIQYQYCTGTDQLKGIEGKGSEYEVKRNEKSTCSEPEIKRPEMPFSEAEKILDPIVHDVPEELKGLELYRLNKKLCLAWSKLLPAWIEAYPGVEILAQVKSAHAWELANPKKRKINKARFLDNWLRNQQDKPSQPSYHGQRPTQVREQNPVEVEESTPEPIENFLGGNKDGN